MPMTSSSQLSIKPERPLVGVGVIILKDNKVLLGKRKNAHGEGTLSFPGGHLEFGEDLEACAQREVLEEAGINIKNVRVGTFTNDVFRKEGKHYITIYMVADYDSGKVKLNEPDKTESWDWHSWDNLPEPLFLPVQSLLRQGFNPFK